jgi:hypothetical protein
MSDATNDCAGVRIARFLTRPAERADNGTTWTVIPIAPAAGTQPGAGSDRVENALALGGVLVVVEHALLLQRIELLQAG